VNRPLAGVPSDNTTLVAVLDAARRGGYDEDFYVAEDGALCCRVCGVCCEPERAEVDDLRRLEGASDPSDMVCVLSVRCGACNARGTAIVRFGPEAGEGDGELLRRLPIDESRSTAGSGARREWLRDRIIGRWTGPQS
jgi:hypothetical protein